MVALGALLSALCFVIRVSCPFADWKSNLATSTLLPLYASIKFIVFESLEKTEAVISVALLSPH